MLKRLPILCAALLALAACSHDNGNPGAVPPVTPSGSATAAAAEASSTAAASTVTTATPATAGSAASAASSTATPENVAPTSAAASVPFVDEGKWIEGKHYFRIEPAQATSHPGKIEVTEVFSYVCPACNAFHPTVDRIARNLPENAVLNYLPASFRPDENWPVFQRAFFTAQALGVVAKTHDAVFDAAWKTGELATYDLKAGKMKPREAWPTIDDIAKFYAKYGVDPKEFVGIANSFTVNTQMKRADGLMKAYGVDSTPSMIVNGKYRFTVATAGGYPQAIELTQWLVAKEAAGK